VFDRHAKIIFPFLPSRIFACPLRALTGSWYPSVSVASLKLNYCASTARTSSWTLTSLINFGILWLEYMCNMYHHNFNFLASLPATQEICRQMHHHSCLSRPGVPPNLNQLMWPVMEMNVTSHFFPYFQSKRTMIPYFIPTFSLPFLNTLPASPVLTDS
jgi:hypothetical protein